MNKYTIGNNEMTITLPLDALTAQLKMQGLTLLLDHELPAFNLAASPQPDAGGITDDSLILLGFTKHVMLGTGYNSISSMTDAVYYYKYGRITINATTFWTWFLDGEMRNDIAVTTIKDLVSLLLKYPPLPAPPTNQ